MASRTPTKAQLEIEKLQAEIRRHNAAADFQEWKAAEEKRLAEEHNASAFANRVYHFVDAVLPSTVFDCMTTLDMWSRLDDGKSDLTIILNSPGGYCTEGLALYDHLEELKNRGHKVTITVRGEAASMGGILLQAASAGERVIGKNAYVLIHEVSAGAVGRASEIKDKAKYSEELWDRLAGILAERSTMTKRQIKNRADRKDWWLDAVETVKLGFADRVG